MLATRKNGFTLIELMIAMMLGIIVTGGGLSMYISTIRASADIAKSARLNYDLDTTMQLMVNDLRRAGYWRGAVVSGDTTFLLSNPFNASDATLNIREFANPGTATNTGDCILYSYDNDIDGTDPDGKKEDPNNTGYYEKADPDDDNVPYIVETTDSYGFKLDRDAVWIRYSEGNTTDCSTGNWERITDEDTIKITHLEFSLLTIDEQDAVSGVHPLLPALTEPHAV